MGLFDASSLPSGPTSQNISSSSVAGWAQPYINQYLNGAQTLANQGPNQAQQNVYAAAGNLQTPGQFGQGTDLLNQAGQGQLGTTGTALGYGQQGVGIGQTGMNYGMGAGQNYANQATNPNSVGAYMNPYLQQSLAPQLALLNQQQQIGNQGIAAQATGQGAFGGNRATLAQGLNNQGYDLAKQQAIGQGYNNAFNAATQAQQFGANLGLQGAQMGVNSGLQGLQTGLQGVQGAQQGYNGAAQAGTGLGNLGAQQGQYNLNQLTLQNQIANQQYQLPWQNLQNMQGMMSGLPISNQTTQGYQAPPNALSQIGGLATTALGAYGLANKAGLLPSFGSKTPTDTTNPGLGQTTNSAGQVVADPTYANPNANSGIINQDVLTDPSTAGDYSQGIATGGQIKDPSYASGGLVSLALAKALKG